MTTQLLRFIEREHAGEAGVVYFQSRKRVGEPKDLDSALMMLCANESRFINGAVLAADDGFGV